MDRVPLSSCHTAAFILALTATCGIVDEGSGRTLSNTAADTTVTIVLGQSRSAIQGAGHPISYLFKAQPGEAYIVELTQEGLDFMITVESPGGLSQTFNSPLRRDEREFVLLKPQTPGNYRITVTSEEPTNAVGEHSLRITRAQRRTLQERRYLEAMQLMSDAAALYDAEDRASSLQALDAYHQAAAIWRELEMSSEYAQALYSVAMLEYWAGYNWSRSASAADEASDIYRNLGLEHLYVNAILLQGAALIEEANELAPADAKTAFATALELFNVVETTHQRLGNGFELAHLYNNIGLTYFYMGEWERARTSWVSAARRFQELGEWREEFNTRQNQAVIDGLQGYNARAIETLQYILDEFPEDKDPQFRVNVLDNLAENHRQFGNYEEALQTYTAARVIHSRIGDGIGEAYSLIGIGNTYYSIGELDLARRHLALALPLAREANDGRSHEAILSRLGDIEFLRSDYAAALELHREALDLAVADPDRAYRKLPVAKDLAALKRHEEALKLATEAATLARQSESLASYADALTQIGRIEAALDKPASARSYFERALGTYESLGLRNGEAEALHGLAGAARSLGQWDNAVRYGQASMDAIESLRERVASPELRAHYSASSRRYYESQIDLLMARSALSAEGSGAFVRAALTTSESSRARLMIDLLREASVDLRSRVDSEVLDEERMLLRELAARAQQRDRLVREGIVDEDAQRTMTALDDEMTELENRLHVVRAELRRSDPAYVRISATETVTADDFQRLLDDDTVLLQYSLADDSSFAWAVTRHSLVAIELPDRATVQEVALEVLANLNAPDSHQAARHQLDQDLQRLATHVLHPFAHQLADKKRLLVVPDGALEYVPFAVLPATNEREAKFMFETHEIVMLPSISVVTALRARGAAEPARTIAIFADPVVGERDPRLEEVRSQSRPEASLPGNSLAASSELLGRLPSTADEAKAIAALVPDADRYLALGFEANRDQVMSMDLTPYGFLHFATHGIADARYPALSSLVLSQFDSQGNSREASLRLYDIFDLELSAKLVVLSACNTALGGRIRGEGLIGLAQGFMYAGARSMLVSLWQVPDRATAELMIHFYQYMLDPDDPHEPAAALRSAQLALAADPRWRHPFFWGAFVLLGDWQ
jgi:CHAT domain-containing protein